jgi:sortase A
MRVLTHGEIFRPKPARSVGRWISRFFLTVGTLAVGYVAFTLLDAWFYQANEARKFEQARQAVKRASSESPASPLLPVMLNAPARTPGHRASARSGAPWGRIKISSIGLSSMILEGVDHETLRRGIGHIPGTALPGEPGNVALAGHRDTFFRALRNIQKDDEITLETLNGMYRYRVDLLQIVAPERIEVLDNSTEPTLTLVTCYPFSFVGAAPQRYVVRASRIPE